MTGVGGYATHALRHDFALYGRFPSGQAEKESIYLFHDRGILCFSFVTKVRFYVVTCKNVVRKKGGGELAAFPAFLFFGEKARRFLRYKAIFETKPDADCMHRKENEFRSDKKAFSVVATDFVLSD
jgi:hypothetical protein